MEIQDQIKIFRDEEIEKTPPPFHIEMSTPTQIKQADRERIPVPRLCKVYYKEALEVYSKIINERIRQRFEEIGIELKIELNQIDI